MIEEETKCGDIESNLEEEIKCEESRPSQQV